MLGSGLSLRLIGGDLQQYYFQPLMENSSDIITVLDATDMVRYQNDAVERLLGFSARDQLGRSVAELVHPADAPRLSALLAELRARGAGEVGRIEGRIRHRDGRWLIMETTATNLLDGAASGGMVLHTRDVTERRSAEEDLRANEERFRALYDDNPAMLFTVAADGTVLSVNRFGAEQLGYLPEQLIARPVSDLFQLEDREAARQQLASVLADASRVHQWELRITRSDGAVIWVQQSARAIRTPEGPPAVFIVCEDVTGRKRLEEQLRQAQKMEAVGRLAGGIAHDFNNVLTAIKGFAELILLGDTLPSAHPAVRWVEEINAGADRAASLTRQLLAFSRQQVLEPRVLDLNATVRDLGGMLTRLIGEDVEFITVLDPELGRVRADPGQLQQVLMNLVVNARDAMPGGGVLWIETRNAELDAAYARRFNYPVRSGSYVLLEVRDTGHGMNATTRDRIFEPFFTTKEPGKGTGLGLSTVYGIVKQSEGYIWVDSEPGTGTSFQIYLPRSEIAVTIASPEPARAPGGSETILVVEDEPAVRALAREALNQRGYTVLEASDGEAALSVCDTYDGPIHLVVTDVVMPRVGGNQLAAILQVTRPEVQILFTSGYTDRAVMQPGVADYDGRFLHKPFGPAELARKVREVLDRSPAGGTTLPTELPPPEPHDRSPK